MAAGRGFSGSNVGFHIELGEEREAERRRAVYDSSSAQHEHWSSSAAAAASTPQESHARVPGNESFTRSGSHSDGSEEYEEEELDLEADGRDVIGEPERNPLGQGGGVSSQVGVGGGGGVQDDGFQRLSCEAGKPHSHQKFGMFPFFNSFSGHENGGVRRVEAGEANGVPESMFYNPLVVAAPGSGEKRLGQGQDNSVRHFLSDPISGILMDDAVIFPCGHSVGNAGYLRVQETNACVVCMLPIPPGSAAPNLALRAAVQAFRRDREFPIMTSSRSAKRRREQDDDTGKVKGVQFPYTVGDRVLIKGNKRTPERFVGREAIITTQCLNGWYLVRTVDNGESVRLQYRSLQKQGE